MRCARPTQAEPPGHGDRLNLRVHTELCQDVLHVALNGHGANTEGRGDVAGRCAVGQNPQDLELTAREEVEAAGGGGFTTVAQAIHQARQMNRRQDQLSGERSMEHGHQALSVGFRGHDTAGARGERSGRQIRTPLHRDAQHARPVDPFADLTDDLDPAAIRPVQIHQDEVDRLKVEGAQSFGRVGHGS